MNERGGRITVLSIGIECFSSPSPLPASHLETTLGDGKQVAVAVGLLAGIRGISGGRLGGFWRGGGEGIAHKWAGHAVNDGKYYPCYEERGKQCDRSASRPVCVAQGCDDSPHRTAPPLLAAGWGREAGTA